MASARRPSAFRATPRLWRGRALAGAFSTASVQSATSLAQAPFRFQVAPPSRAARSRPTPTVNSRDAARGEAARAQGQERGHREGEPGEGQVDPVLHHEVHDGDDARLDREREEEPADPQGGEAEGRVGGAGPPGRGGEEQAHGRAGQGEKDRGRGQHGRVGERRPQRDVVVDGLPHRQDEEAEVADHHRGLGEEVVEARHAGLHAQGLDQVHLGCAGGRGREEERRRDEDHGRREGSEAEESPPPRSVEEHRLEEEQRHRQGEGDLLRPHGEQGGEQGAGVGDPGAPSGGAPLPGDPPAEVEQGRGEVEEGRERGEPLHDVGHRLRLDGVGDEEQAGHEPDRPGLRRQRRAAQAGRPEGGQRQGEHEERGGEVDAQVHRAVEAGVVAGDGPVEREGCEGEGPVGLGRPARPAGKEVGEPVEPTVPGHVEGVVEDEGAREGARVGEGAGEDDGGRRQQTGGSHGLAARCTRGTARGEARKGTAPPRLREGGRKGPHGDCRYL